MSLSVRKYNKIIMGRYAGKLSLIISRDGLIGSIGIIFRLIFALLKYPKSAEILFISSGVIGDSWRFRVENVAKELRSHGFLVSIVLQDNIWIKSCADRFQIFIFHRVKKTETISDLIEKIKAQKKEIIFETDDLVFDFDLLKDQEEYQQSDVAQQEFYREMSENSIVNDPYVKVCTTTTAFLADKLREKNKKVFIVPNKLSKEDIKIADSILEAKKPTPERLKVVKLGYFSGTLSHNKDFATITEALIRIMEKYENVELFLAGPLNVENKLNIFSDRITQLPFVNREKHFKNIASMDINLVPLEIGNPFCEAKSELKFFEAGIVGVPTVAVANQTFTEAIEDGVNGFTASGAVEWVEKLEKLIKDESLRKEIGEKARNKALSEYAIEKADNIEYYQYLRSKLSK